MEQNLETPLPNIENDAMVKRDYWFGVLAGFLIGLMSIPILRIIKPSLYLQLRLALIPLFLIGAPLGLYFCHIISKKIAFVWQFGKFFVTGIMNLLVDFGMLVLATALFKNLLGISSTDVFLNVGIAITFYSLYKAISFTIANINSYFWNKYWTFDKSGGKKSEFIQFFTVSIIGFIVNVITASLVFKFIPPFGGMNFDQWGLIGAAAGSVAGLAWNFLGYKFIVFKK